MQWIAFLQRTNNLWRGHKSITETSYFYDKITAHRIFTQDYKILTAWRIRKDKILGLYYGNVNVANS